MFPVLLRLGPFTLYSYGLMLALGFLAAVRVAGRRTASLGLSPSAVQKAAWVSLLAGIAGARLAYVLLQWNLFRDNLWEIFRLDHGGLVFYGGLAGGLLGGMVSVRRAGLPLMKTADLLVPPLVLAHAIGRIGCFLNGCCYGKPASVPWSAAFPSDGIPRHPTQLYESAFLFLLFFVLVKIPLSFPRRRESQEAGLIPPPGTVLLTYGFLYGIWRFGVEFLRGDSPAFAAGLTIFQWVSLPLALVCGWLLCRRS